MEEHNQIVMDNYPTDSFQYLFWKTQYEAIKTPKKLMRWHPSLIKWYIYLKHKSSSAYELLRSSNCVHLPSQCTLQDYTHFYESRSGFSNDLDLQLIDDSCISSLSLF